MAYTLSQSNSSRFNSLNYNQLFQNPYEYTPGKISKETRERFYKAYENTRKPQFEAPIVNKRSILDRTIDSLLVFNYTFAGGINNLLDDDKDTGFWQGVGAGLQASNPFGKGNEKGEVTFSKVLDTLGWQPESGLGKFARGAVGFGFDVVLDPLTYLGGVGALVKGTGRVGQAAKAIDNVVKEFNVPESMLNEVGKLDKMTPEVAEFVLRNSNSGDRLATLSKTDLAGTIDNYVKTYNRALGLRETSEITLGLRNVPFGDKIADKWLGGARAGVTLAKSNKGLAMIGKYSGASHVYGATRNFLMGRKMIQKLSKTAQYNVLAKTNPIQLYDAVTFLRATKGQQKSIRRATQDAVRKASVLSKLTPAEQDAVIKLVEDPANWKLVNNIIDEAEVKTYEELRSSMGKDLEELLSRRQTMEDTYESVVADLSSHIRTHQEDVAKQLRERGEVSATIREKQYEIDWINAERAQKLAEIEAKKVEGFENVDKFRDEILKVNANYESEMARLIKEQSEIHAKLDDVANALAHERALEVSKGGFQIVKATKEMIDHELSVLGEQFAKHQIDIETAIANRELSFEQAQALRMELSAELEAEAKRIYSRQYYQVNKSKVTTAELKEQEQAFDEAIKALEAYKAKGAVGKKESIENAIAELKNERNRVLSELRELSQHEQVKQALSDIRSTEQFLNAYLTKSFTVDTRFDGVSFAQIQEEFSEQYKKVIAEAFMNDDAKLYAQFELGEMFKLGDEGFSAQDAIADKVGFEQINELRSMLSELIVGSKSHLHLQKGDVIRLTEFIMTDSKNKDAMIKFFEASDNMFIKTAKEGVPTAKNTDGKLDAGSAEYLAEIVSSVGHLPMLRELLVENYGRLSGLDAQFYKQTADALGYKDFYNDVLLKMDELTKNRVMYEDMYSKALSEGSKFDNLTETVFDVLKRVSSESDLNYNQLLDDMKLTGTKTLNIYDLERNMDTFLDDLEVAVMNQLPNYKKTVDELDKLMAIRQVRTERVSHFLSLNHVEKEAFLKSINEDKRHAEFVEDMFNREFERARDMRLQQMSSGGEGRVSSRKGKMASDNDGVSISSYETDARLGLYKSYTYDELLKDASDGWVRNRFYDKHVSESYTNLPDVIKTRIDDIQTEKNAINFGYNYGLSNKTPYKMFFSSEKEDYINYITNLMSGQIKSFNKSTMFNKIDDWLLDKGNGLDKRTKEYRALKKQADEMREEVEYKFNMFTMARTNNKQFIEDFYLPNAEEILRSLGRDSLNRVSIGYKKLLGMSVGDPKSFYNILGKSLNKLIKDYKTLTDPLETIKNAKRKAIMRGKDAEALRLAMFMDANEFQSVLSRALTNIRNDIAELDGEFKKIVDKNAEQIFSIRNFDMDITKSIQGLEMLIPHLMQGRHPGRLYSELKSAQQYKLIEDGFNILRKQFNGEPPSTVSEMLKTLGEKSLDEINKRDLAKAYDKFYKNASENTFVTFRGENGEVLIGRLADVDNLKPQIGSIKVEVVGQGDKAGFKSTVDVEFDQVIRTQNDHLSPIFETLDTSVEKQLINVRESVNKLNHELAERLSKEAEMKPELKAQVDDISKEINLLYKSRKNLTQTYYAKLGELEAVAQAMKEAMDSSKAKIVESDVQAENLLQEYLAKKEASHIAKFEEGDPFTTAVPGTKEWDDLTNEIIEKDDDLKEMLPVYQQAQDVLAKWDGIEEMWKAQKETVSSSEGFDEANLPSKSSVKSKKKDLYTSDVNPEKVRQAKETIKQFDALVQQKALGFQKGDGFLLFRDKMELLDEWTKVRDELTAQQEELLGRQQKAKDFLAKEKKDIRNSKAREKRLEAQGTKLVEVDAANEAEQALLKANTENEILEISKKIEALQKRDAKLGREYDKYNKLIDETINPIDEEIALLQREHARIAKEAQETGSKFLKKANTAQGSVKTLEDEMTRINNEVKKIEDALESNEALDTFLRMDFGDDLAEAVARKSEGLPVYKFAIEDANMDENLKKWAVEFKREMVRIGKEEVAIGKLTDEQFKAMIDRYFPRVLSAEGERFFAQKRELLEHIRPLTADYGFNTKFNNHAIGRVEELRELGIKEVNDFFEKSGEYGVRIFEENLARAYIGRATKHAELMYDDEYTKIIMDTVGYQPVVKITTSENPVASNIRENLIRERNELQRKLELSNPVMKEVQEEVVVSPAVQAARTSTHHFVKKDFYNLFKAQKEVINKALPDDYSSTEFKGVYDSFQEISKAYKSGDLLVANEALSSFADKYIVDVYELIGKKGSPVVKKVEAKEAVTKTITKQVSSREEMEQLSARIKELDEEIVKHPSIIKSGETTFEAKPGYEYVANFGHIREHVKQIVGMQVQLAKREGVQVTDEMIGQFEKQAVENLKIDPKLLDQYKMPMVKLEGEALEKLHQLGLARQMSSQIVEEANMARMLTIERDEKKMLQLFDKFTIWLKAMQTAVMPAFHIRNAQGNLFQNWLAIGADAFSWDMNKKAFDVSRRITDREYIGSLEPIVTTDGKFNTIHWQDIIDEAVVHGVVNEGFFAKDFDGYAKSSGILGGGKWDITSTDNFLPIKKGFEIGTVIENQGRLAQFATLLKKGYSVENASEVVTKYLFDYTDLTYFEKRWMKRIFPYYTWMRKNSVLQVRELMNQPNKYAQIGKFAQSMENSADPNDEIEDNFISNYARDWTIMPFTMKNKDGVDEPVLFSSNLPHKDLAGLPFDPFNMVDSLRNMIGQTSPVFKKPIELLANYNIHYDTPIVSELSGNPITPRLNHVLSELAWYNAVSGFIKQDNAGDRAFSAINTLGGIKMSSYDYESNKRRTVEQAWEDYYSKSIGSMLRQGQSKITEAMNWEIKSALKDRIVKLAGLPPQAGEYSGALAPISEETYNSLSQKEKDKYTKPSGSEMGYINKRALELSEQAFNESGKLKKFGWMLLDTIDVPYKNPIHAVRVNNVVDGDTLSVDFNGSSENVRLLLVDTPESKGEYKDNPMAFGQEAYEYSKQMVLGKDVKLYLDGTDSYGRMLAFIERDESVLNEELLREGLGKVRYLYERDDNNYDVKRFRQIEKEAIDANKGIWSIPGYAKPGDTDFTGGRSSQ